MTEIPEDISHFFTMSLKIFSQKEAEWKDLGNSQSFSCCKRQESMFGGEHQGYDQTI